MRNPREQLVEIENGAHLTPDLGQRRERRRVLELRLEQSRVDDGLGDVCAEQAQHHFIALAERLSSIRQQVECADDLAHVLQRDRQTGLNVLDDAHVTGVGGHIPDPDWALLGHGSADDALADAQSKSPHHLLRIADRVGNPQVALSLVHQIDGEDRKRRHPRDQLWDLLEQLVQVKDGCDFAAKIEEGGQQLVVRAAGLQIRGRFGSSRWRGH